MLFTYLYEEEFYTLVERHIYSYDSHTYKAWHKIVLREIQHIVDTKPDNWLGVYGWMTTKINVTILRTGDLFIKVDDSGAHGVRLTFSPRENSNEARTKKTAKKSRDRSNRVR